MTCYDVCWLSVLSGHGHSSVSLFVTSVDLILTIYQISVVPHMNITHKPPKVISLSTTARYGMCLACLSLIWCSYLVCVHTTVVVNTGSKFNGTVLIVSNHIQSSYDKTVNHGVCTYYIYNSSTVY